MQSKALSILTITSFICLVLTATTEAQGGRGGEEIQLSAGAGQKLIQNLCTQCHGLNQIVRSAGYDQAGWRALIDTMMALPDAQANTITKYLTEHFPERPGRRHSADDAAL